MNDAIRMIAAGRSACFLAIGLLLTVTSAQATCFTARPPGTPYELLAHAKKGVTVEELQVALREVSKRMDLQATLSCGPRLENSGACLVAYPGSWQDPDEFVAHLMEKLPALKEEDTRIDVITKFTTNAPIRIEIAAIPASATGPGKKPRTKRRGLHEDDYYSYQTELQDLGAEPAWAGARPSPNTVTAVIDTGVDLNNPDFVSQLKTGTDIPCPAGNCVGGPRDQAGHGTNMAGYIVADHDHKGITGVAWNTRAMSIASGENGVTDDFRASLAIEHAINKNVAIINASWYSTCKLSAVIDQIELAKARNILFVGTAGNQRSDIDDPNHASDSYPAQDHHDNMLIAMGHGTSESQYDIADSSFGERSVDLAAPGTGFTTMICEGDNCHTAGAISSTSAATAYVSGAAALLKSFYPTWGYDELIWRIKGTVIKDSIFTNKNSSGGRLSLVNMMRPVRILSLTGNGEVKRKKDQEISWETAFRSDMCPKISVDAQVDGGALKPILVDVPTADKSALADLSQLPSGSKVVFSARCSALHPALSIEYPLIN